MAAHAPSKVIRETTRLHRGCVRAAWCGMLVRLHAAMIGIGMLLLADAAGAAGAPISVSVCGTVVGERQVGMLTADLDCGALPGVILKNQARLLMNGHRIVTLGHAVRGELDRSGSISVRGPGEISGCSVGVHATSDDVDDRRRVHVSDLYIHGCTIGVGGSRVRIEDSRVEDNLGAGVGADFGISGRNVISSNNGTFGMVVPYGRVSLRGLTATGNGWQGVLAQRVSLRDATVTGNDSASFGIDIGTIFRPTLKDVTCGLSAQQPFLAHVSGPPWGVCAND